MVAAEKTKITTILSHSIIVRFLLKANPKNPHFLNNIGLSHFKLSNFKRAETYFKRGLAEAPKYISILNNLGNLKGYLNLNKSAVEYFNKILKINDKLIEPYFNLAINYQALGEFEKSSECLKKILELNPKFTDADRILSLMTKYTNNHPHYHDIKNKLVRKILTCASLLRISLSISFFKKYVFN